MEAMWMAFYVFSKCKDLYVLKIIGNNQFRTCQQHINCTQQKLVEHKDKKKTVGRMIDLYGL